MAKRFRLPSSGTAAVSPALQSYTHTGTTRRPLPTTDASALATTAVTPDAADHLVAGDTFHTQFVSHPVGVNVFSVGDAIKQAVQAAEAGGTCNLQVQLFIGLVSNDGATALATLRSKVLQGTELQQGAIRNRYLASTLDGAYTTVGGERPVVELSVSGTPTADLIVDGHNASLRFGSAGASGDLPENDTETGTTFNPWLEFAKTIVFQSASGAGVKKRKVKRIKLSDHKSTADFIKAYVAVAEPVKTVVAAKIAVSESRPTRKDVVAEKDDREEVERLRLTRLNNSILSLMIASQS